MIAGKCRRDPPAAAVLTLCTKSLILEPDVAATGSVRAVRRRRAAITSELPVLILDIPTTLQNVGEFARNPGAAAILTAGMQRAAVEPHVAATPLIGSARRGRSPIASQLPVLILNIANALVVVGQ